MESPPPEESPRLSSEERDQQVHIHEPPSTPEGASKKPICQQPTPMSPTPSGKPRMIVVFDTSDVKNKIDFSEYRKVSPLHSPIIPGHPIIPYDIKSRDTSLDNVKALLGTSTSDEQRGVRTRALLRALLHNAHRFTSASRGLRANGEKDPWSDSEDEDESDDKNQSEHTKPHLNPQTDLLTAQKPTEESAKEEPEMPLLGHKPELGNTGIETEEDLRIFQDFRRTHNVAVASAACGQLVFPQLGPRPSPPQPQGVAPTRKSVVSFKIPDSSSSTTIPTKNKAGPKHRIITTTDRVHGPTGQLIPITYHSPSSSSTSRSLNITNTTNPTTIPQKRKPTNSRTRNRKKKKSENDTDFDPSSEVSSSRGERTAVLETGRRNPTRTTSAAGKKAAAKGGKGRKKGRPKGSKNKPKTVNEAQRVMLMGVDE